MFDRAEMVTPPAGGPPGVEMPYGALAFTLTNCTANRATLTATFSGGVTRMTYWKYIDSQWVELPGEIFESNTVNFTIDDRSTDQDAILSASAVGRLTQLDIRYLSQALAAPTAP